MSGAMNQYHICSKHSTAELIDRWMLLKPSDEETQPAVRNP